MTRAEPAEPGRPADPIEGQRALAGRAAALKSPHYALFVLAFGSEADQAALGRALDATAEYEADLAEAAAAIRAERSRAGPGDTTAAPGPIIPEAARPETRKPLRPPSPTVPTVPRGADDLDGGRLGRAGGDGGRLGRAGGDGGPEVARLGAASYAA